MNYDWHNRAELSIANGYLTNSKRANCFVFGCYPTHVTGGRGVILKDTEGKQYVDYICGLGTNLLGYGNEYVNTRVIESLKSGISHSLATTTEVLAAEKIKELFPFVDRTRFLKSGSEACTAATKIARASTGRKKVLTQGYHGWHSEHAWFNAPALGCFESPTVKMEGFSDITSDVAAVIVEPVITDWSHERVMWLQRLRETCTAKKVLLIFDEVITGMRFPKYSVARYYNIEPDIIVLGKGLANGFPLAAVCGTKKAMESADCFVSSTYAGDTCSLTASIAVMEALQTEKYPIGALWHHGENFLERFNRINPQLVTIEGYPTRGAFKYPNDKVKALFMQEMALAGILIGPSWFFAFGHDEYTDMTIGTATDIIRKIERGEVKLKGEIPATPYAQKVRDEEKKAVYNH